MRTKILKIKGDWNEILNDCRATVKKEPIAKEPSQAFKKKILLSEHSPIRAMTAKFAWYGIKYWVAMHWKTHRWESRVDSQRNDRQDRYDREKAPQDAPVDFIGDPNIQHTIDTWRKRLCRQASKETREYAEDFKMTLREVEPEWSNVLVPNCVYRCGCPELKNCGWFDSMVRKHPALASTNIQERYDAYNALFYGEEEKGDEE